MKKTFSLFLLSLLIISLYTSAVYAKENDTKSGVRQQIKQERQEIKTERNDLRANFQELKKNIVDKIKSVTGNHAKVVQGKVTAKSGSTLTVTKNSNTYTVNVDSNTKIIRHFWGKSSDNEISVGDQISVYGQFTDDTHSTINASLIRDLSIMKRLGAFIGIMGDKQTDRFVLDTKSRGKQTVVINADTKFTDRTGKTITYEEMSNGDRIRVKGMWDKSNNTVTETNELKDFSIPAQPKVTGEPEETQAPTAAPTEAVTVTPTPTASAL